MRVISAAPHHLLSAPFMTINVDDAGERGLLGITLDPGFSSNRLLYVYYTVPGSPAHNRVSSFKAQGDKAVAGSGKVLFELDDLRSATNHNGGAIHFGTDGKLYVAVGDDADGSNAQSLENLFGKVLRINSDGSIPSDNPFYARTSGQNRAIWALGFRNLHTFAFRRTDGRMHVNDVGQDKWEEIDRGLAGANYGWPIYEGPASDPAFQDPVLAYKHTEGCAITGGAFYDPVTMRFPSSYVGDYFYTDFCGDWIRRFDPSSGALSTFVTGLSFPVDLTVDDGGFMYWLERTGDVWKVKYRP